MIFYRLHENQNTTLHLAKQDIEAKKILVMGLEQIGVKGATLEMCPALFKFKTEVLSTAKVETLGSDTVLAVLRQMVRLRKLYRHRVRRALRMEIATRFHEFLLVRESYNRLRTYLFLVKELGSADLRLLAVVLFKKLMAFAKSTCKRMVARIIGKVAKR